MKEDMRKMRDYKRHWIAFIKILAKERILNEWNDVLCRLLGEYNKLKNKYRDEEEWDII